MARNYPKIKGRVAEKFGTISNFAKAYGISTEAMCQKLKEDGRISITTKDIEKMSLPEYLDIPAEEIPDYFFV